ncbi:MAG: 3-dehydroquinate synthase [Deltaproteobacteria bacterium]|nr:3-dehydroquinate synthase [Deltaproteobacteria bacterium]
MRTLEIKGITGTSRIMVGERLENLKDYIPADKFVIITDKNVGQIYGKDFPECEIIQISTGEKIKNIETLQYIYEKLLALEADRSVFIIGIGGGIVCDIAGFIASTYLRGVRFGFVSSTLLAQVDASVGGKNGVNFHGYKNMIGNFNQPEFVICDMNLLKTLPKREVLCGFGEIAKHAFIGDAGMCDFLEQNYKKALNLDEEVITRLVYDSVVIKSTIVNRDEREKGERKKLNFGHTFGHAIEKTTDILLHGEAISVGMVVASHLSASKGLLSKQDVERIETLLAMLELPTTLDMNQKKMIDAIKRDKKRQGDDIDFVLLDGIGNAVLEKISIKELEDVVLDL